MRHGILIFLLSAFCYACSEKEAPVNKFSDPLLIRIAEYQDKRLGDSLLPYLDDASPTYRQAAALAFGSIQDSAYLESLKVLLKDTDTNVREAAAYAIGQTVSLTSAQLLREACLKEVNDAVLAELIEAFGKVSRHWDLDLSTRDSVPNVALAWSYYRMAVRGFADQALNSKSIELLKSPNLNTRLAAAHFFARGAKDFDHFRNNLIEIVEHDSSTEVKMAVALALQKIKSDSTRYAIEHIIGNESDYRVKINAIRALQGFPLKDTKLILTEALNDSITNVGIAASEVIKSTMTNKHWREFNSIARHVKNWRIQANLYEAALAVADHKELAEEIRTGYNRSIDPYQRAALLTALQHSIMSYEFVREQLMKTNEPVVRVAAATALTNMNYSKKFPPSLRQKFAKIYQEAIGTADAAVIGIIANTLSDSTLNYKTEIKDYTFLKDARNKLSSPKDFESIVSLETALSYFEGKKSSWFAKNEFNHPIDWGLVKKIPFDQQAVIKTSKGDITIRLLVNEAPGSVANFVALALSKYYDGKFFHRVVPNFVVQGGCPRGDGYGSEAYSIRSEFYPHRYQTGSIGMASAGKDTEGTQWFITHSPTPHLEGRYTLFGEVEEGMAVVHRIEVGDKILSVDIINLNLH